MYRKFLANFKGYQNQNNSEVPTQSVNGTTTVTNNNGTETKKNAMSEEQKKKAMQDLDALRRQCDELEAMIRAKLKQVQPVKKTDDEEVDDETMKEVHPLFYGNVTQKCPSSAKVVRIFTSSTFTDTEKERNTLMEQAYPKIKLFCQQKGYEFQVVDMRWGVRDEATDDHMTTELCLRELKKCQEISTGPYFVSLLSHKYGYRPLSREIEATEFEKILNATESDEKRQLMMKWYKRDDNNVPPVYVLKSISKNIPDFVSNDREKRRTAKNTWWEDHEALHETLSVGADNVLDEGAARKYRISVTETEVLKGILENSDKESTCVWFKRNIVDIEKQEPDKQLARYIECLGSEEKVKLSKNLLHELRDIRLPQHLPQNRISTYTVHWGKQGIDPENEEHKSYLQRFASDFVQYLCKMVDEGIRRRAATQINNPLYEECLQHVSFCREKCEDFQGREETLQKIKDYILGENDQPMVIHGSSGCGKTSIMAMAAMKAWEWLEGKIGIVLRFVGTTPKSSTINDFLHSVTRQVKLLNRMGSEATNIKALDQLTLEFLKSLRGAKPDLPLLILIDSLDQFDPTNSARQLAWLPSKLPKNVKMLVSTLEDEKYECFPKLRVKIKSDDNFLPVPVLPDSDVTNILNHWLNKRGRTLLSEQRRNLLEAFRQCSIPLFLKLSFDEACRWTSHDTDDSTVLQTTVHDSINTLFARLEKVHGYLFVSRALGYMTAARSGVSEAEMEDILACDDDVLNDVYQYWTPPTRRLPPLLLVRLKSDLQQYLVERGVDGVRVMFWYHRQFIRAAKERYCSDENVAKLLHKGLADYFSGTWAGGKKKPYIDKNGTECEANRFVAIQPLQFGIVSNIRKLNKLPYHLIHSSDVERYKQECLCNYKFLQLKLIETSVSKVLDDIILAESMFPEDKQIQLVHAGIQLSQQALMYNPTQLPSQMIGRIGGQQILSSFIQECEQSPVRHLRPNQNILTMPGGALKFAFGGHKGSLRSLDLKKNGEIAVTSSDDKTIQFWNIKEGRNIRCIQTAAVCDVFYVCDDNLILADFTSGLVAYRERGDIAYKIPVPNKHYSVCSVGPMQNKIAIFQKNCASIYVASNGEFLEKIEHSDPIKFDGGCFPCGSENYAAALDHENEGFTVVNLKTKQFSAIKKAFPKDEDGDYPTIDTLVITTDEKYIICASCMTNDLYFFDIDTLEQTKIIKGVEDDFSQKFHMTHDGKYLYFPSQDRVVAFDLHTEERKDFFEHDASLVDAKTLDFETFITITDDSTVRVWDNTKSESKSDTTPQGFHPDDTIREIYPLMNARYVLCIAKSSSKSSDDQKQMFCIFDVVQNQVVRKADVKLKDTFKRTCLLNDSYLAVVTTSRKLKIIDITTMTIQAVCQGKLHNSNNDVVGLFDGKEVAVPSRGSLFVKIYDTTTGKTLCLMKGGQKERILNMKASSNSSILLALTDEGPYLVFNLNTRQCIQTLDKKTFKIEDFAWQDAISSDGKFIGMMGDKKIYVPPSPVKKINYKTENVLILWDVEQGKVVKELHDRQMMLRYHLTRSDLRASADEVINLGNRYMLTSHDDFIMRVWDNKTGDLVKRLYGHSSNCEMYALDESPYIISNASWDEEKAIRVWDSQTFQSIASFQFDKSIKLIQWLKTGKSFITTESNRALIVHWQIYMKGKPIDDLSSYPVLYPGTEFHDDIELLLENDELDDPDDLDTDVDEPESEYDDDDDDDDEGKKDEDNGNDHKQND